MKRKRKRRIKLLAALFLFCTGFTLVFTGIWFCRTVRPRLKSLSQSYAKNEISQAIDSEVQKVMLEELFSYDKIVNISRDESGRVTSVTSNATFINKFTNDLGIEIGQRLDELCVVEHYIYLSSIMGADIFCGTGPKIPIRFCPISVTGADITHRFEEAGINQTLHTVDLTVTVEMEILMPLAYSRIEVESSMPIAQTLVVGFVPEAYFNKK